MVTPSVDKVLATAPPDMLYHYTSSTGLIRIAESKKLWATNILYLNDSRELDHAMDYA